jgi:hypothetical protein
MTKMVFIQEIEDVTKWLDMANARKKVLGRFAKDIVFHLDADSGNQVALTMDVHDLETSGRIPGPQKVRRSYKKAEMSGKWRISLT